jgi:hypothetical protein
VEGVIPGVTVRANGSPKRLSAAARRTVRVFCRSLGPAGIERLGRVHITLDLVPGGKVISDLPGYERYRGHVSRGSAVDDRTTVGGITPPLMTLTTSAGKALGVSAVGEMGLDELYERDEQTSELIDLHFEQPMAVYAEYAQWPGTVAHEMAHVLYESLTRDEKRRVRRLYAARESDTLVSKYAEEDHSEYFCESVGAFLRLPMRSANIGRFTPEWLEANDPGMYALLSTLLSPRQNGRIPRTAGDAWAHRRPVPPLRIGLMRDGRRVSIPATELRRLNVVCRSLSRAATNRIGHRRLYVDVAGNRTGVFRSCLVTLAYVVYTSGLSEAQRAKVERSYGPWIEAGRDPGGVAGYFVDSVLTFHGLRRGRDGTRLLSLNQLRRLDPAMFALLTEIFPGTLRRPAALSA